MIVAETKVTAANNPMMNIKIKSRLIGFARIVGRKYFDKVFI
jgi:hypothetical protein